MTRFLRYLALAALLARAFPAAAHEGSTSYLLVDGRGHATVARFDVALIDIAWAVPLDADEDKRLTWDEVWASRDAVGRFIAEAVRIGRGGEPCIETVSDPWLTERLGLPYLSVDITTICSKDGAVGIASDAFFDTDASHRMLVSFESGDALRVATLAPSSRTWTESAGQSIWRTAVSFVGQGMWHVWIGYDHLLFLLLLLLPAVTAPTPSGPGRSRAIAIDLARVVTAFTVAHSITLAAAATETLRLPQQPIEAAIALSIVIAAGLNLVPSWSRFRLPLAFGFGLVHGFGFANALAGLGSAGANWPALAGFNIGVEFANLAVVALLLPVLLQLGLRRWYAPRALPALSLASAAIGAAWLVDRL